ncbi:MAG: adenylate/guanylate cyclase domain-containing protein, partial [bacterium]
METSTSERKLLAILVADVVGYSRLMGEDDEATVEALTACRKIFSETVGRHGGRVVNAPGDSILAEFDSVVNAVAGAVEIQRELAERNAPLPGHRRMEYRIGVNLGDVIAKDDAIYGDGVNIAARLESLAEPGEICMSGNAYDQVKSRLPLEFESLGKKAVKNIAEPVPVFRVLSKPGAAAHRVVRAGRISGRKGRLIGLAASVVIVAGVIAAG